MKKEKEKNWLNGADATIASFSSGALRALAPGGEADERNEGDPSEAMESVFKLRLGRRDQSLENASELLGRRYAWRGFPEVKLARWDNRLTIIASLGARVAGTVTVGYDSEKGMLADEMYKEELDALRAEGRKLGELSKFAVDEELGSKELLASLVHVAYIHGGLIGGCTDAVIEILPRHKGFYEKMLGFSQIGAEKMNQRVHFAVILMRLDLGHLRRRVDAVGGMGEAAKERSLYPYFFSPEDERGIQRRLLREIHGSPAE